MAGLKQSRFLECIDNNVLIKVTKDPTRKCALLNLMLTNNEELIMDVKVGGCLGCRDHEMVEFRILGGGNRAKSRTTTLDFIKEDINLFRDLTGRIIWSMSL